MLFALVILFGIVNLIYTGLCPYNDLKWELRNKEFKCRSPEKYHCFCGNNGKSELCTIPRAIRKDICVIGFRHRNGIVEFIKNACKGKSCPKEYYPSHKTYLYESCINLSTAYDGCTESDNTSHSFLENTSVFISNKVAETANGVNGCKAYRKCSEIISQLR